MITLTIDHDTIERIREKLRNISPADRDSVSFRAFRDVVAQTERDLKRDILSGQVLNVRTGRLRSSIGFRMSRDGGSVMAVVGSGVRQGERVIYANIHETGGVIVPQKAKALVFQLPDGRWVRTQKVTIPARRYLSKTVEHIQPQAETIIMNRIAKHLESK